jgi:hypothetical protein
VYSRQVIRIGQPNTGDGGVAGNCIANEPKPNDRKYRKYNAGQSCSARGCERLLGIGIRYACQDGLSL